MSANDALFDAQLRHAIGVRRLSTGEVARILALLRKSEAEIEAKLSTRESQAILRVGNFTTKRFKLLLKDIRELRKNVFKEILASNRQELIDLAKAEQAFSAGMLNVSFPVELNYAVASAATLRGIVTTEPFGGVGTNAARSLSDWWAGTAAADQRRIIDAIQLGMTQEEPIADIVRRVVKSTSMTRQNAEAVVRTAVNHVSNRSREAFFEANKDVIKAQMLSATLDGRTSPVCRANDGHYKPASGTDFTGVPRPWVKPKTLTLPAHVGCRSSWVGILDADGVEQRLPDRPFVRDARTRRRREIDFRANAKEKVGPNRWKRMSVKQRNDAIRKVRQKWTREIVGQVPGKTTYDEWMRKQPVAFQNEVLGVQKAQAFRKGLKLDKFVDRQGSELTLKQLKVKFPEYMEVSDAL